MLHEPGCHHAFRETKAKLSRWFSSSGNQRQWHTCTQVLNAERDESPTRYFRALGDRQDIRVIWQTSLHPYHWVYSRSTEKNARQSASKTSRGGPSTESWAWPLPSSHDSNQEVNGKDVITLKRGQIVAPPKWFFLSVGLNLPYVEVAKVPYQKIHFSSLHFTIQGRTSNFIQGLHEDSVKLNLWSSMPWSLESGQCLINIY